METCTVETGLLKKKPCGHNAVTHCANCEQPLCKQHVVRSTKSMPASSCARNATPRAARFEKNCRPTPKPMPESPAAHEQPRPSRGAETCPGAGRSRTTAARSSSRPARTRSSRPGSTIRAYERPAEEALRARRRRLRRRAQRLRAAEEAEHFAEAEAAPEIEKKHRPGDLRSRAPRAVERERGARRHDPAPVGLAGGDVRARPQSRRSSPRTRSSSTSAPTCSTCPASPTRR